MSLGEADAKFPGQRSPAIPPSPSRENPGQVYPKSDPNSAPAESIPGTGGDHQPSSLIGNPFALKGAFGKLDSALGDVISALEGEEGAVGSSSNEEQLLSKFRTWRTELGQMQGGQPTGARGTTQRLSDADFPQEGGMFTD